jgi:hypothetical protein
VSAVIESQNQQSTAVTPMQMLSAALERGADMAQLQQLMDLQERWEGQQARKAFVQAMAQFKANPPEIVKTKQVSFGNTNYKHATLADVCAAAIQGLAQVGISHSWQVKQDGESITVTCVLTHLQGHSESVSMTSLPDKSGQKNSIQALASATSYLQRYTLMSATGLAAKDQDDDGRSAVEYITEQQEADLRAKAEEVGANMQSFLRFLKVQELGDLPASRFKAALQALEDKARGAK